MNGDGKELEEVEEDKLGSEIGIWSSSCLLCVLSIKVSLLEMNQNVIFVQESNWIM